ncbi:carboxypeptidase B-like isoform X2 [Cydia pomonella]|uniref:carboxypeptidase B-like isoform X2 n=1 Tax=Cydia pomonella TaxID=82600 RepID=UPI002ADE5335|nr:carboxypeptidase B-like isoform X2 [Cydia pomonella]
MNLRGNSSVRQCSPARKKPNTNYSDEVLSISTSKSISAENSTQTQNTAMRQSNSKPIAYPNNMKQLIPRPKVKRKKVKYMDWKRYHKLSVIYAFIDDLEKDYPAICTVYVIGKSIEGRDIKMLKISNSDANNSSVWLDGAIHPREWITTAVVTFMAENIVKSFNNLSTSITNKDWHIVPVLNPDGYEYSHTKDRMWRKNRALYGGNCVGVDLNRNFSYGWGHNGEEGSSEAPENIFYRGPAPFSEPETAADYILGSPNRFEVFLSFHSYFEMIIFPWGFKKDPCPDYLNQMEAGMRMAKAIYDYSGMTYKVGCTKDLTYYACGTSIDWSYAIANIPYSFMIELRSRKYKFKLPKDQIFDTCMETWSAVKSLMEYVDNPLYQLHKPRTERKSTK